MDDIKNITIIIADEKGGKVTALFDGAGRPMSSSCYQAHNILAKIKAAPKLPAVQKPKDQVVADLEAEVSAAAEYIGEIEAKLAAAGKEVADTKEHAKKAIGEAKAEAKRATAKLQELAAERNNLVAEVSKLKSDHARRNPPPREPAASDEKPTG